MSIIVPSEKIKFPLKNDNNLLLSVIASLLGTNYLVSLGESLQARSSERVCNDLLLRFGAHNSALAVRKTVPNGPRGCYGFSPGSMPRGMTLRGTRYYLRRHVLCDIQPIIGRAEVWRSLKTDSLQVALRRFPRFASHLESELERIRHDAGLSVDETLLRPSEDGLRKQASLVETTDIEDEVPQAPSLALVYARYMVEPMHRWSPSTRQAYETTRKFAIGIIGGEVAMEAGNGGVGANL